MVEQITFQKIFEDYLSQQAYGWGVNLTIGNILINLAVSCALAFFIYFIYKKTYTGVMYNKNFNITLVMTSLIVTAIMMTISGNLALSLGMVGALSIIRFRTAIKDPKDVTFLFWAVSVGIINGVAFYKLSIALSVFIGAVAIFMSKKLPIIQQPYILIIKYNSLNMDMLDKVLAKHSSRFRVRNMSLSKEKGEKTIELRVKKNHEHLMLKEINAIKGVKKVILFTHEGELTE